MLSYRDLSVLNFPLTAGPSDEDAADCQHHVSGDELATSRDSVLPIYRFENARILQADGNFAKLSKTL